MRIDLIICHCPRSQYPDYPRWITGACLQWTQGRTGERIGAVPSSWEGGKVLPEDQGGGISLSGVLQPMMLMLADSVQVLYMIFANTDLQV